MPWVARRGTQHRYYVQNVYRNGQTVQRYFGRGKAAQMAASFDEARRKRKRAQREKLQQELQRIAAADEPIKALEASCRELTAHYLTAIGLHQHHREWRKKRGGSELDESTDGLIRRAQAGDHSALPLLESPEHNSSEQLAKLYRRTGDLSQCAIDAQINLIYGKDLIAKEGLRRKAIEMCEELMSEHPTPLEQVLIGEVVSCWVGVNIGCMMSAITLEDGLDKPLAKAWEKRHDRALMRFHRASQALARTSKLLRRPDISNAIKFIEEEIHIA